MYRLWSLAPVGHSLVKQRDRAGVRPMVDPGVQALEGKVSEASWKSKPSWYLVATDDRMIPPPAQQFMSKRAGSTVVESKGSHSVYVSQPGAVATLIETAAQALQASGAAVK